MFYMMSDHLQEAYKSIYQRKELVSPPKDAEGTQGIMNPQGTPKAAQGGDHARQEVTKGRYRAAYEEYKQELRDYHIEKFIGWVESLDEDGYDISKWELSELSETYIRENNLQDSEEIITEALSEGSVRMARMVDRYLGRDKRKAKERRDNVGKIRKGREEIASTIARLSNSPGGVPASVARQAEKVGVRPDHFRGAAKTALKNSFEPEGEQLDEMPFQVMGSPDGKKEKKIGKPVKSKKYADARAAELADTHRATGGQYRSQYVEDVEHVEEGIKSAIAGAGLAAAVAAGGVGKAPKPAPQSQSSSSAQVQSSKPSAKEIWAKKHPGLAAKEASTKKPSSVKSQLSDIRDMISRSKERQQQNNSFEPEGNLVDEKMNLATADMGDVIKDFQKSDAPQFKGKTKKERQKMAIAAKLTAERGGKRLGES